MRGREVAAWCLYDWAMSAYNTLISTFVFSVYFTKSVAESELTGTSQWGLAASASGILVAVLSPALGAIADRGGRLKPWLFFFTLVCVLAVASLYWVKPSPDHVLLALIAVAIGNLGFELAGVFYNALLPRVAAATHIGRVSGWGWGLGYFGGLVSLALCLTLLVQPEQPLFGLLSHEESENIRATGWLVAIWYGLFAIPLFVLAPDRGSGGLQALEAVREGMVALRHTLKELPRQPNLLRFLIASALWRDGISTITAFGGIYAATQFGMTTAQILLFAILLNVTAGAGAAGFAWLDDSRGARLTIQISLVGLFFSGLGLLLVGTPGWAWAPALSLPLPFTSDQQWLLLMGLVLGAFFGPAQAAGRSLMARLAPPGLVTEMFGLYALTGRVVGFIGPLLFAAAVALFTSQRAGLATTLLLFVLGSAILATVREPKSN
jgi:UMF1 family MFS transporter